jgi:hypothetical protein
MAAADTIFILTLEQEKTTMTKLRSVAAGAACWVLGAILAQAIGLAIAAFTLPGTRGPGLGDDNVNPYTLAQAINQFNQQQTSASLTALAGGGQTGATQLIPGLNVVGTVASAADSVQLPPCSVGAVVYVNNGGAQSTTVFGAVGRTDTINGTAGATGVAQAAAAHAVYFCAAPGATSGAWTSIRANS